jgi:hypothetical protein
MKNGEWQIMNERMHFGFKFPPALAGGRLDRKRLLGFSQKAEI